MKIPKILLISGLLVSAFMLTSSQAQDVTLNRLAVKAPHRLLMDIKKLKNERLVAVGERGHILISDDKGITWTQKLIPSDVLLTKLFFMDEKLGWAVGHQQTILKTTDSGEHWEIQHQSNNLSQPALFDIWFKDELHGVAIGAYGLYLATVDGGSTWEAVYQQTLENPEIGLPHFYSIAFEKKSQRLFIAGEFGLLASSSDFGDTWQLLESPYQGSFFNIAALNNGDLIVMGLRGHLFRSTDLGESWQSVSTGTIAGLQEAIVFSNDKVLIVGSDGTQLISSDNAKTVRLVQRKDRVHLASAVELSNDQFLTVGINGVSLSEIH